MSEPQIQKIQDHQYKIKDTIKLNPEIIDEIKVAIKESKEGKVITNDRFEEYFCK